jgi:hypothetical protein
MYILSVGSAKYLIEMNDDKTRVIYWIKLNV